MSNNDFLYKTVLGLSNKPSPPTPKSLSDLLSTIRTATQPQTSPLPSSLKGYLPPFPTAPTRSVVADYLRLPQITPQPRGIPIRIVPPSPKNRNELTTRIQRDTKNILEMNMKLIKAQKIPAPQEVANDEAKVLTTSVLHVDMRKSSQMLEIFDPVTALRIYKIFHAALVATARLNKGQVRTFAGDRIGVVFDLLDTMQRSVAVETAILMEDMLENVVNPILSKPPINYTIQYGIGVDYGQMFVGRIGQSGSDNNDLAWVGAAMNTASKLADIPTPGIYVTDNVYTYMSKDLKDPLSMMWRDIKDYPQHGLIHKWIMKL